MDPFGDELDQIPHDFDCATDEMVEDLTCPACVNHKQFWDVLNTEGQPWSNLTPGFNWETQQILRDGSVLRRKRLTAAMGLQWESSIHPSP